MSRSLSETVVITAAIRMSRLAYLTHGRHPWTWDQLRTAGAHMVEIRELPDGGRAEVTVAGDVKIGDTLWLGDERVCICDRAVDGRNSVDERIIKLAYQRPDSSAVYTAKGDEYQTVYRVLKAEG